MSHPVRTFLIYKAIVLGLALVAMTTVARLWPDSPGHFVSLLFEWDAKHILRVASQGYLAGEPSIQILPLVPLAIRLFHLVIRNWEWAAFVWAQTCSLAAFTYFYKLARLDLDETDAVTALTLFALFPTAFFLTAPYSEAMFCAFSFALVYHVRKNDPWPAGLFGLLTGATRITGVVLVPALAIAWWLERKKSDRRALLSHGAAAGGILLGYLAYLGLNKYLYNDAFYYLAVQSKFWGVHLSWPLKGAVVAFARWNAASADHRMSIILLEVGFTAAATATLPLIRKRRPKLDFAYMSLSLLLLLCMDFWLSRPRYVLPLYPMFLAVAPWFRGAPLRLALYLLGSTGLFAMTWALYLNAQWAY